MVIKGEDIETARLAKQLEGIAAVREMGEGMRAWKVRESYEGSASVSGWEDTVVAASMAIEGGALVFRDAAGQVQQAWGPGAWWHVVPVRV